MKVSGIILLKGIKNILYEKVGGIWDLKGIDGVKSKEIRSYQKGNVIVLYSRSAICFFSGSA